MKSFCPSKWFHIVMGGGVQSYLKPLYVFCNETGIFDLEEGALGAAVIKENNPWQKPSAAVSFVSVTTA